MLTGDDRNQYGITVNIEFCTCVRAAREVAQLAEGRKHLAQM